MGIRKNLLLEISIVTLLLVILIGLSIPRFFRAQSSATLTQVYRDMSALHKAFEAYFTDHNAYPPDFGSGEIPGAGHLAMSGESTTYKCLTTPVSYINPIPLDVFALEEGAVSMVSPPHYEYAGPGTHLIQMWASSGTQWTLISIGPDLYSQSSWNYSHDMALKMAYHSSNGMLSSGDIYASNLGVINPMK